MTYPSRLSDVAAYSKRTSSASLIGCSCKQTLMQAPTRNYASSLREESTTLRKAMHEEGIRHCSALSPGWPGFETRRASIAVHVRWIF